MTRSRKTAAATEEAAQDYLPPVPILYRGHMQIYRARNPAVSEILCVDRVYLGSLFGISELIPKISNQIGWQIG
jgi:hypothetical protein